MIMKKTRPKRVKNVVDFISKTSIHRTNKKATGRMAKANPILPVGIKPIDQAWCEQLLNRRILVAISLLNRAINSPATAV